MTVPRRRSCSASVPTWLAWPILLVIACVTAPSLATAQTYVYFLQFGGQGSGNGQFQYPNGSAVDKNGNVYVVDQANSRIEKFTSNGSYLSQWGSTGSGNGQFLAPTGIAVDTLGNVYVTDTGNHRVQKFTTGGFYLAQWGTAGSGPGQFTTAYGIAVDVSGQRLRLRQLRQPCPEVQRRRSVPHPVGQRGHGKQPVRLAIRDRGRPERPRVRRGSVQPSRAEVRHERRLSRPVGQRRRR